MSVVTKTGSHISDFSIFKHVKYEHLVAGISGGVTSTLILHPLDVVKIRFAVHDGNFHTPKYAGIWNALTTIFRQEGVHGLYRGVVANVWGAGASWGFYFLFYTTIKTSVQGGNINAPLSAGQHLLAASEAGLITLFMTNPFWVVKTRLCLQYGSRSSSPEYYNGMIDALVKIYRAEGFKGYYKGLVPGMFGVSHGAVQFMVYDQLKTKFTEYYNLPISTKLTQVQYLTFAALSKIVAAGTTYPYQVVRARLQNQHYAYRGSVDCIKQTWMHEGWRGFYKGLGTNLFRVTPATMITFLTYENVSHFLMN